ncbi:MAG: signal peptidase I [Bdellovibrionales bacterium]
MSPFLKKHRASIISFGIALSLAMFFRVFAVSLYKVPTSSMLPNLYVGDIILGYKLPYQFFSKTISSVLPGVFSDLKRGDVVIFRHPKTSVFYVKRILGLGGDKIILNEQGITVNGEILGRKSGENNFDFVGSNYYESFIESVGANSYGILLRKNESLDLVDKEFSVGPGEIFVVGDNRDSSDDSRDWGPVPVENIVAKVNKVVLSFQWSGSQSSKIRFDRLWVDLDESNAR